MSRRLPEIIDPFHLVDKHQTLKGVICLSRMKRLAALSSQNDREAALEIYFGRDEAGLAIAKGTINSVVRLQCQRWLEPMDVEIKTDFTLGVVSSLTEASSLPENYEPLIVDHVTRSLTEIVEDEILLALPAVAMHADNQCAVLEWKQGENAASPGMASPNDTVKGKQSGIKENNSVYNAAAEEPATEPQESRQNPFAVLEQLKGKLGK
jgi:uncharacterized protein